MFLSSKFWPLLMSILVCFAVSRLPCLRHLDPPWVGDGKQSNPTSSLCLCGSLWFQCVLVTVCLIISLDKASSIEPQPILIFWVTVIPIKLLFVSLLCHVFDVMQEGRDVCFDSLSFLSLQTTTYRTCPRQLSVIRSVIIQEASLASFRFPLFPSLPSFLFASLSSPFFFFTLTNPTNPFCCCCYRC